MTLQKIYNFVFRIANVASQIHLINSGVGRGTKPMIFMCNFLDLFHFTTACSIVSIGVPSTIPFSSRYA